MHRLIRLVIACSLALVWASAFNGSEAAAQDRPFRDITKPYHYRTDSALRPLAELFGFNTRHDAAYEREWKRISDAYQQARVGLEIGDPNLYRRGYQTLRTMSIIADDIENRHDAQWMLRDLPDHFARGFAYARSDGTVAADPDPRIRSTLKRGRYSKDGGDGADGGDD